MPSFFSRVPVVYRPAIEAARALLPPAARRIEPRFLCGVDPRFAGLHSSSLTGYADYKALSDRDLDYDTLAHCVFTDTATDERQTICFPRLKTYSDPVTVVVHEWGHCLDEYMGFTFTAPTTTPYSEVNRYEAFAEAFEIICRPPTGEWRDWVDSEPALRPMRELLEIA